MSGGWERYGREELLDLLMVWNNDLVEHGAKPLLRLRDAVEMPVEHLRLVVAGTSRRLASVVRAVGEQ